MSFDNLDFESCGYLTLDEGGEGVRSWSDNVVFLKAEVPGGHLVLAARDDSTSGVAMTFVPNLPSAEEGDPS